MRRRGGNQRTCQLGGGTAQQQADVVARLARVEKLVEHLDARARRLLRLLVPHDLDLVTHLLRLRVRVRGRVRVKVRVRVRVKVRDRVRVRVRV